MKTEQIKAFLYSSRFMLACYIMYVCVYVLFIYKYTRFYIIYITHNGLIAAQHLSVSSYIQIISLCFMLAQESILFQNAIVYGLCKSFTFEDTYIYTYICCSA